jgi:carboxyl-terminal processing protease
MLSIVCPYAFSQGNAEISEETRIRFDIVTGQISRLLQEGHYSPRPINDSFSSMVFNKFLEELDGDKNILLQSDVKDLSSKYLYEIDDEILNKGHKAFFSMERIYTKRLNEVIDLYPVLLSAPFDFSIKESVQMDPEKISFPASENVRREIWRKRLKYLCLARFSDLLEERERNKEKADFKVRPDSTLERESREQVLRQMNRYFSTRKNRETIEEKFSIFINSITALMDPHTNYFPPLDLRTFNESMRGSIYGIGAQLREDDGKIKITSLVTGGPAWKSGELHENDEIMKVGQGDQEPVDVSGYGVSEAVKLIKGSEKGSVVKLTVRKVDGSIKVITLVRDEVKLDDTFVKSAIIKGEHKIGYVYLPEFYIDFERLNGSRCSVDMAKELKKLKEEKVDGIIIDLRGNGGGSLPEVVNMVGQFIDEGPVCQVKGRYEQPNMLKDREKGILYDGPLAVMVDEASASASEIFAAAIQDYRRGLIIGSTSTFGKGTVQRNIPLGKQLFDEDGNLHTEEEMGSLKLTLQKFYRINGGSTQLKGVTPDIILPDRMEYVKFREKDQPSSLPWDEIPKAQYVPWQSEDSFLATLRDLRKNAKQDVVFNMIKSKVDTLELLNDKEFSLNLSEYREEQRRIKEMFRQIDTLTKLRAPLDLINIPADTAVIQAAKEKAERNRQWIKRVSDDVYIDQSVQLMNQMIKRHQLAARIKE